MPIDSMWKSWLFTQEEYEKIIKLYKKYGNDWKKIAEFFPDKSNT